MSDKKPDLLGTILHELLDVGLDALSTLDKPGPPHPVGRKDHESAALDDVEVFRGCIDCGGIHAKDLKTTFPEYRGDILVRLDIPGAEIYLTQAAGDKLCKKLEKFLGGG